MRASVRCNDGTVRHSVLQQRSGSFTSTAGARHSVRFTARERACYNRDKERACFPTCPAQAAHVHSAAAHQSMYTAPQAMSTALQPTSPCPKLCRRTASAPSARKNRLRGSLRADRQRGAVQTARRWAVAVARAPPHAPAGVSLCRARRERRQRRACRCAERAETRGGGGMCRYAERAERGGSCGACSLCGACRERRQLRCVLAMRSAPREAAAAVRRRYAERAERGGSCGASSRSCLRSAERASACTICCE